MPLRMGDKIPLRHINIHIKVIPISITAYQLPQYVLYIHEGYMLLGYIWVGGICNISLLPADVLTYASKFCSANAASTTISVPLNIVLPQNTTYQTLHRNS